MNHTREVQKNLDHVADLMDDGRWIENRELIRVSLRLAEINATMKIAEAFEGLASAIFEMKLETKKQVDAIKELADRWCLKN